MDSSLEPLQWLMMLGLMQARGFGVLLAIPVLLKPGRGWKVRLPLALAIALPSLPAIDAVQQLSGAAWIFIALKELAVGAVVGAVFMPLFLVAREAGVLVDQQAGLMMMQLLDPTSAERQATVFADAFEQCTLVVFLGAGGLAALADLYATSHLVWPVGGGGGPSLDIATRLLLQGLDELMRAALRLSSPFLFILIVLEVGLGLLGRAAPQWNVMTSSISVKLLVTLLIGMAVAEPMASALESMVPALAAQGESFMHGIRGVR
mgnify:FL=1